MLWMKSKDTSIGDKNNKKALKYDVNHQKAIKQLMDGFGISEEMANSIMEIGEDMDKNGI